jgi:hypothetical protein
MQVMSNGRVRRNETEQREVVSRWEKSGVSPAQFCRREQIRLSSFLRWRQKERPAARASEFVAVTPAPAPPSAWALEITLPNGCQLRFQG